MWNLFLFLNLLGSISSSAYDARLLQAKIASSSAKAERRARDRQAEGRPVCQRCHRSILQCVCDALPSLRIPTATRVLIVQHPREFRKKSVSTVPLLSLVLENIQVVVGKSLSLDVPNIRDAVSEGYDLALLFPGKEAIALDAPVNEGRAAVDVDRRLNGGSVQKIIPANVTTTKIMLILVDGTWSQAGRMIRNSPEVVNICQRVQFTSTSGSIYHVIRREPKHHCISTLEACSRALELLEPNNPNVTVASKHLDDALQKLVNLQLNYNRYTYPPTAARETQRMGLENPSEPSKRTA